MIDTTILGFILAVTGNTLQGIGLIIQKRVHIKLNEANEDKPESIQIQYTQSKTWICGLFVLIISTIIQGISLIYIPATVILPLQTITLCTTAMLSILVLNETWNVMYGIGFTITLIAIVFVLIYGPRELSHKKILDNITKQFTDNLLFLSIFGGLTFITLICIVIKNCFDMRRSAIVREYSLSKVPTSRKGNIAEEYQVKIKNKRNIINRRASEGYDLERNITYLIVCAWNASYFGGLKFLFLKAFVEIIDAHLVECLQEYKLYVLFNLYLNILKPHYYIISYIYLRIYILVGLW